METFKRKKKMNTKKPWNFLRIADIFKNKVKFPSQKTKYTHNDYIWYNLNLK